MVYTLSTMETTYPVKHYSCPISEIKIYLAVPA
jgi:hypothetical protein